MQILNADANRRWDEFTIQNEPVSSIDLMERAAQKCVEWLDLNGFLSNSFHIFCGKGNNGGDGLAIARLLFNRNCPVKVYILEFGHLGTEDFQENLHRLHELDIEIVFIQDETLFHELNKEDVVIDCLYGTGLNRPLDGISEKLVQYLNQSGCRIISIDIPSGLATDQSIKGYSAIKALHTLSFQVPKLAFFLSENESAIGNVHILDIGLHPGFLLKLDTDFEWTDISLVKQIYRPRNRFSHKGTFGHALLVAGSHGKMGAAVLAAKACLRSGVGLLTCQIPECGYNIMQTTVPEAMVSTDVNMNVNTKMDSSLEPYKCIGMGPGIGKAPETKSLLENILIKFINPFVLDADALNILSENPEMISLIPPNSILTPHPKEFERLFGPTDNEKERIELARLKAKELNVVIVLKGHHSLIATPAGKGYFNTTGNAGMATGGTGDVLTGILTGLLTQGYDPVHAAILGVYLHGLSGDLAAQKISQEALIAQDLVDYLGEAFLFILQ